LKLHRTLSSRPSFIDVVVLSENQFHVTDNVDATAPVQDGTAQDLGPVAPDDQVLATDRLVVSLRNLGEVLQQLLLERFQGSVKNFSASRSAAERSAA
jgi:hypothetical protein